MVVSAQNIDQYDQSFNSFKEKKKKRKQPQTILEAPPMRQPEPPAHEMAAAQLTPSETLAVVKKKEAAYNPAAQKTYLSLKRTYDNYRTNMRLRPKLDALLGEKFFRSSPKSAEQCEEKLNTIRNALGRGNAGTVAKGATIVAAELVSRIPSHAFPEKMGPVDLSNFGQFMNDVVYDYSNDEVQDLYEEVDCEYNEWCQMGLHSRLGGAFVKAAVVLNKINTSSRQPMPPPPSKPIPTPSEQQQQAQPQPQPPRKKKKKEHSPSPAN